MTWSSLWSIEEKTNQPEWSSLVILRSSLSRPRRSGLLLRPHIPDEPTANDTCTGMAFSLSVPGLQFLSRPGGGQRCRWALLLIHHWDLLRDLLLWVRAARQLVQVLHVAEALGNTLGCQTGLRVVVPALVYGGAHHLDALQGEQWSAGIISHIYWLEARPAETTYRRLRLKLYAWWCLCVCTSVCVYVYVCVYESVPVCVCVC